MPASTCAPDAPAISDESRSVTWSELATRVHQIASALAARGVKEGDLVTVSSDKLGALTNRMRHCDACPPWDFGAAALMRNLAARGLLQNGE